MRGGVGGKVGLREKFESGKGWIGMKGLVIKYEL